MAAPSLRTASAAPHPAQGSEGGLGRQDRHRHDARARASARLPPASRSGWRGPGRRHPPTPRPVPPGRPVPGARAGARRSPALPVRDPGHRCQRRPPPQVAHREAPCAHGPVHRTDHGGSHADPHLAGTHVTVWQLGRLTCRPSGPRNPARTTAFTIPRHPRHRGPSSPAGSLPVAVVVNRHRCGPTGRSLGRGQCQGHPGCPTCKDGGLGATYMHRVPPEAAFGRTRDGGGPGPRAAGRPRSRRRASGGTGWMCAKRRPSSTCTAGWRTRPRHDGEPGVQVIWRGLRGCPDIAGMWRIMQRRVGRRAEPQPRLQQRGNGRDPGAPNPREIVVRWGGLLRPFRAERVHATTGDRTALGHRGPSPTVCQVSPHPRRWPSQQRRKGRCGWAYAVIEGWRCGGQRAQRRSPARARRPWPVALPRPQRPQRAEPPRARGRRASVQGCGDHRRPPRHTPPP